MCVIEHGEIPLIGRPTPAICLLYVLQSYPFSEALDQR